MGNFYLEMNKTVTLFSLRLLANLIKQERRRKIKELNEKSIVGIVTMELNRNCWYV